MKKIKPVLSSSFKDCGISCMQWIFIYYNGYVSLEKLREDTLTDINGTNAYQIVNAFKKWGFDAVGIFEKDLTKNNISFPLIAHLSLENGLEHFVVVKGISPKTIYIMDPGNGDKVISKEKFNKLFTGHIILCKPRSTLIKMAKGLTLRKIFFKIIGHEKSLLFKIILTSIILTLISILSSYYLKVGCNILSTNIDYLKYAFVIFGFLILFKCLFNYIKEYYLNHLNNLVDVYLFPEFLHHIFYLPFKSIKSRSTGEVMMRINELSSVKSLFSEIFVSCFLDTLMMLSSMFILYTLNKLLWQILMIFMVIYLIYGFFISKLIYKDVLANIDYDTSFHSVVLENIKGLESLKNLNLINTGLFNIEKSLSKYLLNNYEFNNKFNNYNLIKNIILETAFFLINSFGLYFSLKGNFNIINLFTFDLILNYFTSSIQNIINILPKYNFIKATIRKIEEFINIEEEKISDSKEVLKGNIRFKKVSYSYNNYDYILKNKSFNINAGEHILLNGKSGSGKSTICKLIHKDLKANYGDILIDNINVKDLSINTIRNNILYVSQNEELFTATIRENILLNRQVSLKKFENVCRICELEDIVSKKSLRYDALIENEALNISGGEKQRIILARGLLKDASIIILDEALSEVDKNLEDKIIKNIHDYFKNQTLIYISHKNQTKNFTKIIEIGEV